MREQWFLKLLLSNKSIFTQILIIHYTSIKKPTIPRLHYNWCKNYVEIPGVHCYLFIMKIYKVVLCGLFFPFKKNCSQLTRFILLVDTRSMNSSLQVQFMLEIFSGFSCNIWVTIWSFLWHHRTMQQWNVKAADG